MGNHTVYIQLPNLCKTFYQLANSQTTTLANVNIIETTLTGTSSYDTMVANKFKWKGVDDDVIIEPQHPKDRPNFEVALQPQRIRAFDIEFVHLEET